MNRGAAPAADRPEHPMKRRDFLQAALATAAVPLTAAAAPDTVPVAATRRAPAIRSRGIEPSDTLRMAILGAGSRGQYLVNQFLRLPGVRFDGICDVYAPRFAETRAITAEATPTFDDYRRLLDRARDFDALVIATPLGLHADHAVAALDAGLHLFLEKSLALNVEGCNAIRAAALRSAKVFQIGTQYRYAGWYAEAVRRIRAGAIGRPTHIHAYWHRNYNWRRPVPDPSLERLLNWRLYREWSGGLLAELGSHHIDTANWIFEALPERVVGDGGITFYRDGRETFDHVQAIYRYPGDRMLFFSSIIGNQRTGFQIQVFGTGGSVELTLEDATMYYEPARAASAVPAELLESTAVPSLSTSGDMPYRGPGERIVVEPEEDGDPGLRACAAFTQVIRTGMRQDAGIDVAWAGGVSVACGIEAIRSGTPVSIADRVASGG